MVLTGSDGPRARVPYTALFAVVLLVFYGGLAALWMLPDNTAYKQVMRAIGVHSVMISGTYAKPPLPFYDLEGVLSWSECAQRGVNVLYSNPCDPAGRLLNYSPLLRDLPFHHIRTANTVPAGLVLAACFLLMLVAVFRPCSMGTFLIACLASLSQAVVFALERSNIDIAIFVVAAATSLWSIRSALWRGVQYGVALLCGVVKFYPLAMLVFALREAPRVFASVAAISILSTAIFAGIYWDDLLRIFALLPRDNFRGDMFGVSITLSLLQDGLSLTSALATASLLALCLLSVIAGWRLSGALKAPDFSSQRGALLLCGSALILGCFGAGGNVAYRAIFLLMALPGLVAMVPSHRGIFKVILAAAVMLILACLWGDTFRANLLLYPGHLQSLALAPGALTFFLLREAMWWYVVAVLSAILICFVRQSPLFKTLAGRFSRHSRIELQP